MKDSRLYICVLDEVPDHIVPTLVAHTVMNANDLFMRYADYNYQEWKELSFRKCVCRVNRKEFEKIAALDKTFLGHENKTLNGEKSCAIAYPVPNDQLPNVLKFAKLWAPVDISQKV
jgi:hypothetical protein